MHGAGPEKDKAKSPESTKARTDPQAERELKKKGALGLILVLVLSVISGLLISACAVRMTEKQLVVRLNEKADGAADAVMKSLLRQKEARESYEDHLRRSADVMRDLLMPLPGGHSHPLMKNKQAWS